MRNIIFFIFFFLWVTHAYSQKRMITGKVMGEKNIGISGASIMVKGSKIGTVSSADGSYSLAVPSTADTLIISSVNFMTREVRIADNLSITLQSLAGNLSEVLVVAYGQLKKTNLTGSLAIVKSGDVENKPFTSVDKALQGAVAGLQSTSQSGAPGAITDIRIRGIGSITADASPLWVIDGAIATTGEPTIQTTTANALSSLNPDDIESITVLKDAATASVYGSRAANGVILVTTKKGKGGRTTFAFTAEDGSNTLAFHPRNKPVNSIQSQTLLREGVINAGLATDDASADALISNPVNGLGIDPNYTKTNTDWLKVVTRAGRQAQYNLSLSGGDEKTQFYASGGLFNQLGNTIGSGFQRYNGSISVTHKPNEQFTFNAGLRGGTSNQNTPNHVGASDNPVLAQSFLLPWYSPYNADGSFRYNDPQGEFPAGGGTAAYNPVIIAAWDKYNSKQTVIRGNLSGEYRILSNLELTSRYSAEYFDISEDQYNNPLYGTGYPFGYAQSSYQRIFDWTWSNFADYRKWLSKDRDFYFDLKAGYEAYQQKVYQLQAAGQSFPPTLALQWLATAAMPLLANSIINDNTTSSLFSVADLNYKERYILSGSYRRDASSRFGADHKWGNFYSAGLSWNINEEYFLKDSRIVNLLKLRGSYGQNGNQSIGNYTALATFGYGFNYTGNPGSALTNIGNPDLTWEKNAIFNLGVDLGLFKNRLYGTIEYYERTTSGLLIAVPLSLTSGVSTQNRNAGAISNKGVELTLGGKPVMNSSLTWDINFNFSYNKNRVTQLYLGNPIPDIIFNASIGHDFQEFYLPEWIGANPADGTPLWYTDGTHSKTTGDYNQAQYALTGKSASPKIFGAITNSFTYKGISLQIQIYYNLGNYIYDYWGKYKSTEGAYLGFENQSTDELSAWQKPGDKTSIPQIIYGGNNNSFKMSTRYLYKGDYARLRNFELSYSIINRVLKSWHILNLVVYVRGTNLLTFVADRNLPFDPEKGLISINGFDVYTPRTLTGGIKIGF